MGPVKGPVRSPPKRGQSPGRPQSPVRPIERRGQISPVRPLDPARPTSPVRPINPGTPRSPGIPRRSGKRTPSTSSRSSRKDVDKASPIISDNEEELVTEEKPKERPKQPGFWASLCKCCFPCCNFCQRISCACCTGTSGRCCRPNRDSDGQGQSGGQCKCPTEDTPAKYSNPQKSGPRVEFDDAIFVENTEPKTRDVASGPEVEGTPPMRNSVQTAKRGRRK